LPDCEGRVDEAVDPVPLLLAPAAAAPFAGTAEPMLYSLQPTGDVRKMDI